MKPPIVVVAVVDVVVAVVVVVVVDVVADVASLLGDLQWWERGRDGERGGQKSDEHELLPDFEHIFSSPF